MLTNEQRAEIARQNGRKSKGPKTAEGKARSAKNNLKHGAHSELYPHFVLHHSAVLHNEDRQAFYRILEHHVAEYRPASPVTLGFVRGMAEDQWCLNRLDAFASALFTSEIHRKAETFIPIFPELANVLQTLNAAQSIAAQPGVINLVRRLRREHRASRRDNYNLLVDHRKHFPPDTERPQSIEIERIWASQADGAEFPPDSAPQTGSGTKGETTCRTECGTQGGTACGTPSGTAIRTQPPTGQITA